MCFAPMGQLNVRQNSSLMNFASLLFKTIFALIMRFFALVLVFYLLLLTVSPAVCQVYEAVSQVDLCCTGGSDEQCNQKDSEERKSSNTSNSCTPCSAIQNCCCYFVMTTPFKFSNPIVSITEKIWVNNESVISDYLPDCWHPPETV